MPHAIEMKDGKLLTVFDVRDIPQTADTFPLTLLIAILAISGGAVALLIVGKKRSKK